VLGRDGEAALMTGAIESASGELGMARAKMFSGGVYAEPMAALARRLGPQEWERLRGPGRELSLEQASEHALGLSAVPG
jgi:hypothetical protein